MRLTKLAPLGKMPRDAREACVALWRALEDYERCQGEVLHAEQEYAVLREATPGIERGALQRTQAKTLKEARLTDQLYAAHCEACDDAGDLVRGAEANLSMARHRLQTFTTLAETLEAPPVLMTVDEAERIARDTPLPPMIGRAGR